MGSPFAARVCRTAIKILDHSTETGRRVLGWAGDPVSDALALRLCGALHALILQNADPALISAYPPNAGGSGDLERVLAGVVACHDATLSRWLDSPPQTNETARSAVLLPGFLAIARETGLPLALNEIGSSAGLNLFPDKYRHRFGKKEWGDAYYPVTLAPELRGAMPELSGNLRIASRTGCDIAPLDVHDENDRLRLRAYIWPDQPERLARLDAAIAVAQSNDFVLELADAAEFVRCRLASRKSDECFVLFHSVVWQYLPDATQASIANAMNEAGAAAAPDKPLAWLRMEGLGGSQPGASLELTLWPGGKTRSLAKADFHGRWLEWLA